jgi:hypothetical protein
MRIKHFNRTEVPALLAKFLEVGVSKEMAREQLDTSEASRVPDLSVAMVVDASLLSH